MVSTASSATGGRIWEITVLGQLFPQKKPVPEVQGGGGGAVHTLPRILPLVPSPLPTQVQLQCLDEGIPALVTEETSKIICVQCPNCRCFIV